jgi:hypothetical protein
VESEGRKEEGRGREKVGGGGGGEERIGFREEEEDVRGKRESGFTTLV